MVRGTQKITFYTVVNTNGRHSVINKEAAKQNDIEERPSLEILHREFQLNPLSQLGNSGLDKTNLSQLHHLQLTTGQSILSQVLYDSGTVPHRLSALNITDKLQPPSIYSHLPHMIGKPESLVPNIKASQGRTGVSLVFGIPTVKRSAKSYLIGTYG